MLKNRYILSYTAASLILMCALCCCTSLSAQPAQYINAAGSTVETRFILPEGYKRVSVVKNSYAYFLRRLRMMPSCSAYNNGPPESHRAGMVNLPLMDYMQEDIHLCVRLRGEYLFSSEQYDKIAFSISVARIFYTQWAEGLNLVINDKPLLTKQPAGVNRLKTLQNYLYFIFYQSNINSILLDVQPVSINNILPGDMFIQPGLPCAAVIVLDVASNPATGDRIFLLAKTHKSSQSAYILTNPKEAWSGSPWYSIKMADSKVTIPDFVFCKSDLRRFISENRK